MEDFISKEDEFENVMKIVKKLMRNFKKLNTKNLDILIYKLKV